MRSSRRSPVVGFTLLEVIVVVAILAILATMAIPRLAGQERRTLQLAVDQIADLLTMYAQRDALTQKPVGIRHDAERNWIVLMVMDIDPSRPQDPPDWRRDPFVVPVKLPPIVDPDNVFARENGKPVDFQLWPIASAPGMDRLSIEISLIAEDGLVRTLVLPSHALAPYELDPDEALVAYRSPIDLDAAGQFREDW